MKCEVKVLFSLYSHYEKHLFVGMALQRKHLIAQFMQFRRQFLMVVDFECNILNYNSLCILTLASCQSFLNSLYRTSQDLLDKGNEKQSTSAVCTHFLFQHCLENLCYLINKFTGRKKTLWHPPIQACIFHHIPLTTE